jgi:KUP system potassium uptake protein
VVYGDIGTSPLYALRECFHGEHAVTPAPANVLGVLSLIVWSLTLIVTVKYLVVVMRADNHGEGGILALMARWRCARPPGTGRSPATGGGADGAAGTRRAAVTFLGLFGAALLYGDGLITPPSR